VLLVLGLGLVLEGAGLRLGFGSGSLGLSSVCLGLKIVMFGAIAPPTNVQPCLVTDLLQYIQWNTRDTRGHNIKFLVPTG